MPLSIHALIDGISDTATRLAAPRLEQVLRHDTGETETSHAATQNEDARLGMLERLDYYYTPTLSHLMALLLHPVSSFPKTGTSLIVIDSLSALLDNAYPRGSDDLAAMKTNEHARWLGGRRQAVTSELAAKLTKLAAMNSLAILVTNYATTKIRAGARAILRPAVGGQDWEKALGAGIILLRGSWPQATTKDGGLHTATRLAGVVDGRNGSPSERTNVELSVEFTIEEVMSFYRYSLKRMG